MKPVSTTARGVALGMLALLALSGCSGEGGPASPPDETPAATAPTPEPPATFDPLTAPPAPPLPDAFATWTRTSGEGLMVTYTDTASGARMTATHWTLTVREDAQLDTPSEPFGDWLCGEQLKYPGRYSCAANVWDGALTLWGSDLAPADLAAVGDELLAVWGDGAAHG